MSVLFLKIFIIIVFKIQIILKNIKNIILVNYSLILVILKKI